MQTQKGFTLIELLVVIAIVAILSVVVILTLNPAELLRQARDSNRVSDMNTIKTALALYMADVNTVVLAGDYTKCYMTAATGTCTSYFASAYLTTSTITSTAINGTGWVGGSGGPNFTLITAGTPISALPIDPVNNSNFFYGYAATSSNTSFKLVANMESTKYANGGSSDAETNDGGTKTALFELGTNLAL